MTSLDAALQAAAEAADRVRRNRIQTSRELADAALYAAMPAIREAIAQEIEAEAKRLAEVILEANLDGITYAARIVRDGTP